MHKMTAVSDSRELARKVVILDEGSTGHVVQSRGLAKELSKRLPVEVLEYRIPCRLPRKLARSLGKRLLDSPLWKSGVGWIHPLKGTELQSCDLLVASGPHALNALRYLGRQGNCPTVFVQGTLNIPEGQVDLIVRPDEGEERSDYVFIPMLFTEIDPNELTANQESLQAKYGTDEKLKALFIGNSSAKIVFEDRDWDDLAEFVNRSWSLDGVRWLISTSYRTGSELERRLRNRLNPEAIAKAVWYSEMPEKITKEYLSLAYEIYVTMDSLTMATEAASSGKPCYLYSSQSAMKLNENTHVRYIRGLVENGYAQVFDGGTQPGELESLNGHEPNYSEAVNLILQRIGWRQ
ncbi:hypothetical protein Rhal01_01652 [Rubritalea halochordaticola]|uniref:Nucleoside-diphosphate sugar epimerase n=1 Tax=Rubritalea halochordaticola TaxID=714537 RepID=A0ABP9UYL8_9BACT